MKIHGRWLVAAAGVGLFLGVQASAAQPKGPWAAGEGGRLVTGSDGAVRYAWPAVPDEYVLNAPLEDIAAWLPRAWSDEAMAYEVERRRTADAEAGTCMLIMSSAKVEPLTKTQWNMLAHRAADALRLGEVEMDGAAMGVVGLIDGMMPEEGWPRDGYRAVADELLLRCKVDASRQSRGLGHLAASFAARAGDTGFVRRVTGMIRQSDDPALRGRLAAVVAASLESEHDLSQAEAAVVGMELLTLAEEATDRFRRVSITRAAMHLGGLVSIRLMDDALASDQPEIRGTAISWAIQRLRTARAEADARTEQQLTDRTERLAAMMADPDEQVASYAVTVVIVLFEADPAVWATRLIAGLGTRVPAVDALACMYLMEFPKLAAPAKDTLEKLATSRDPDLHSAANELLAAIKAGEDE